MQLAGEANAKEVAGLCRRPSPPTGCPHGGFPRAVWSLLWLAVPPSQRMAPQGGVCCTPSLIQKELGQGVSPKQPGWC